MMSLSTRSTNGVLLLNKPIGLTSNAALQKVKRLFATEKAGHAGRLDPIKAGHTGSLDPIATGMLPICFREATKFSQFLLESDKAYQVTVKLGEKTITGDSEGTVSEVRPYAHVTAALLQEAMRALTGPIQQVPPMFSAIKYHGQPLYVLARKGIEIERPARPVTIYQFDLSNLAQDTFTCFVKCSKGTYVRTLVEDCVLQLDTVAHVQALHRLYVTPYETQTMYTLPMLEHMKNEGNMTSLRSLILPITSMVQAFPSITLSTAAAFYLRMGQAVRAACPHDAPRVQLISEQNEFLGVGTVLADGRIQPERLLSDK